MAGVVVVTRNAEVTMWDERFEEALRRHLPFLPEEESLDAELSLRDFGLDSMGTVALLSQLEKSYDVRFTDDSLDMEHFATPARLWSTLESVRR